MKYLSIEAVARMHETRYVTVRNAIDRGEIPVAILVTKTRETWIVAEQDAEAWEGPYPTGICADHWNATHGGA